MEQAVTRLNEALRQKRHQEGALILDELLREAPQDVKFLSLAGALARERGDLFQAHEFFRRAVVLQPGVPELHNNLGVLRHDLGENVEALSCYDEALRLAPRYGEALSNRANALRALGRSVEAVLGYREAIACAPDNPEFYYNLGNALRAEGEWEEAVEAYHHLLALDPAHLWGWVNLCGSHMALGRGDAAIHAGRRAVRLSPESPDAHWNLALALLSEGEFLAGWREYEWRLADARTFPRERAGKPLWDGSPLAGRTILVVCEQGFGDAIQFIRYVPLLACAGARVVVECRRELVTLFSRQAGVAVVVQGGASLPDFDTFTYLLSLPRLLGTELSSIPAGVPYLTPDPGLCASWRERLGEGHALKVGVVWAGSAGYKNDRNRSLEARHLSPLGELPDVELYSLQIGEAARAVQGSSPVLRAVDLSPEIRHFSDTAAIIANLDLVVAVDTAVAHLCGALGKPVWVLIPKGNDWRWLRERDDSPWYPTMRLYRQDRVGEWSSVVARVRADLKKESSNASRLFKKGNSLASAGKYHDAFGAYRRVLDLEPSCAEAYNNLGLALQDLGLLREAMGSYRAALALRPGLVDAENNLGTVLSALGEKEEAALSFERAIALAPDYLPPYLNLGGVLQFLERPQEALPLYLRAIALRPDALEPRMNLSTAWQDLGEPQRAIESCREALSLYPDSPEAHWNLALNLLMTGEYEQGWREYEWRLKGADAQLTPPSWRGEALAGEMILLRCEQGFGDTFHFARYVELVAQRGGRVVLECQSASLKPLLARLPGVCGVVARGEELPPVRRYAPLLSLPHIFGTTLDTVPTGRYLTADPAREALWRQRLAGDGSFRVGLVWKGGPLPKNRACPFPAFAPLAAVRGVSFYSLQLGEAPVAGVLPVTDLSGEISDFGDTAAIIANLDLVISVDTAVAHLAGGMGVPVWTLLPRVADWRWLMGRDDSPWYPAMRLFRQERGGDWDGVIRRVCEALRERPGV
ncbi:tetratricopeptide repeat protein [Geomonas sp. RF6]|uniref:tetratricopeptide repeat protein n=1 Tax=Geomonas sp. RF6 TaxID=2897342 RepID=UPI001E306A65|nr:tetratricopeptide repeat protein [Geomonas sp. RF6]UFS72416.1 tetratricopeptide repeat protein [Geomonas sp. RF6]